MFEEIKSLDFSDEMKINELFPLFKTKMSPMDIDIISKLQYFSTSTNFFKHYMNKDIKKLYEHMNILIYELSSLTDENKNNKFNDKVDKYISDFSYIYVCFNLIIKINEALLSILLNTKNYLSKLYKKYGLDKNYEERINKCIQHMIPIYQNDIVKKNTFSNSLNKANSNFNIINLNDENKEFSNSNKEQILINDLLGKDQSNLDSNTPRFNNENNFCSSILNNKESSNMNNNDKEEIYYNFNLEKQKSLDSQFTLSPNKKNIVKNEEKTEKEYIKSNNINNISNKDSEDTDDIKNYISNISPEDVTIRRPKSRKSCIIKSINSKENKYRNRSIDNLYNNRGLFSTYKGDTYNLKTENKGLLKKLHISSEHLFMKENAKKYAELLEIIYGLYKNHQINLEEKIKIKKLIICKSPKILNIYENFNNDNDKFINELKRII